MTNSSHALCVVDQKGKKVSRANALIAATFISLSGLAIMLPQPAAASCYGTDYASSLQWAWWSKCNLFL